MTSASKRGRRTLIGARQKRGSLSSTKQLPVIETELLPIEQLRPTQMAVGMRAVTFKRRKLELRASKRRPLKKIAQSRLIPAIRGPGREVFMIDNHHFALALWQASQRVVNVGIIDDYSHLSHERFWQLMEATGRLYPYDEQGCRIDPNRLPLWLHALRHDPFCDLAWEVREAGGFAKVRVPYAEFQWANYFRDHFSLDDIRSDYRKTVKKAISLCASNDANALPGYCGRLAA